MVSHQPDPVRGDGDVEGRAGGDVAREQVVLLDQRVAVDGEIARVVAAHDVVPAHPDDPLDVVTLAARPETEGRCHRAQELRHRSSVVLARPAVRLEGATAVEDDDVAPLDLADAVGELVDEHSVADQEGVLHRLGRDVEGLHEERLDEVRQDKRHDDEDRQLTPQRSRRLLVGLIVCQLVLVDGLVLVCQLVLVGGRPMACPVAGLVIGLAGGLVTGPVGGGPGVGTIQGLEPVLADGALIHRPVRVRGGGPACHLVLSTGQREPVESRFSLILAALPRRSRR